jgi:hypothetical protein
VGTASNPTFVAVQSIVKSSKAANGGVVPKDFYSVQLPTGFATSTIGNYDMRSPDGLKLVRLRNSYNRNWGTLSFWDNARYLDFSLRITF